MCDIFVTCFVKLYQLHKAHPTSETPCLSVGCNSCPGCVGTRAARCVLLGCGQTGGTLWSQFSGCLQSAGFTHNDWQQQQHYTSAVPLNSWTRAAHEARLAGTFISASAVIDKSALICGSPGLLPKVQKTDEVGERAKERCRNGW